MTGHAGRVQGRPAVLVGSGRIGTGGKQQIDRSVLCWRSRDQRNGDVAGGGTAGQIEQRTSVCVLLGEECGPPGDHRAQPVEVAVVRGCRRLDQFAICHP